MGLTRHDEANIAAKIVKIQAPFWEKAKISYIVVPIFQEVPSHKIDFSFGPEPYKAKGPICLIDLKI